MSLIPYSHPAIYNLCLFLLFGKKTHVATTSGKAAAIAFFKPASFDPIPLNALACICTLVRFIYNSLIEY